MHASKKAPQFTVMGNYFNVIN